MMALLWFKKIFWVSAPFLLGLFLVFLSQVPSELMPYYHQSFPFVTGLIFYFAIFNPKALNVFWVFLLGLIMDTITSVPLGFNAFGFVFIFFIANLFQSYLMAMTFLQVWFVYALLFFCTDVLWAFLFFIISGTWVATSFWTVQYFFTALSFPLFCRLYGSLSRKTQEDDQ